MFLCMKCYSMKCLKCHISSVNSVQNLKSFWRITSNVFTLPLLSNLLFKRIQGLTNISKDQNVPMCIVNVRWYDAKVLSQTACMHDAQMLRLYTIVHSTNNIFVSAYKSKPLYISIMSSLQSQHTFHFGDEKHRKRTFLS